MSKTYTKIHNLYYLYYIGTNLHIFHSDCIEAQWEFQIPPEACCRVDNVVKGPPDIFSPLMLLVKDRLIGHSWDKTGKSRDRNSDCFEYSGLLWLHMPLLCTEVRNVVGPKSMKDLSVWHFFLEVIKWKNCPPPCETVNVLVTTHMFLRYFFEHCLCA